MVSVAIIGQEGSGRSALAAKLGKKGNVTDITMYDFVKGEQSITYIDSSGYPVSPKPLMSALAMSEMVLLCIPPAGMDPTTGECIIAVDLMGMDQGIIVQTMSDTLNPYEIKKNATSIRSIIKGTAAQHWEVIPVSITTYQGMEQLKASIDALDRDITAQNLRKASLPPRVIVDHSFNVKGIGSVVLGRVIQGTIHTHDTLTIHPIGRQIEIRNIQINDVNKPSAGPGSRVGLSLKGIQAKEVQRGHIISNTEISSNDIEITWSVSKFSSGFTTDTVLHLYVHLQSAPVTISEITINGLTVHEAQAGTICRASCSAEKVLSFGNEDTFILADLNNPQQRFVAGGHVSRKEEEEGWKK